jgi:hypothetical protein
MPDFTDGLTAATIPGPVYSASGRPASIPEGVG